MKDSLVHGVDPDAFASSLRLDGVATGIRLPDAIVGELLRAAETTICYADRDPRLGFPLSAHAQAQVALGKPILLAQYFNLENQCAAVRRLREDPFLQLVSALYLGSLPAYLGTNMWWTFPVDASEEDRIKFAHRFHNDVDDFAFLKFFFYLTDVDSDDGAHVVVPGSHNARLIKRTADYWTIRRYTDEEVEAAYGRDGILAVGGPKGTGFAEDTLCIHKASTPVRNPRLLLQFQFALFDYLMQHDNIDPTLLKRIV